MQESDNKVRLGLRHYVNSISNIIVLIRTLVCPFRFKELKINCGSKKRVNDIKGFLLCQTELENLKLELNLFNHVTGTENAHPDGKQFLFFILNQLPKLKKLKFILTGETISFTFLELGEFLKKIGDLEYLGFDSHVEISHPDSPQQSKSSFPSIQYTRLKELNLFLVGKEDKENPEEIYFEILSRCCSLQKLKLYLISGRMFPKIFTDNVCILQSSPIKYIQRDILVKVACCYTFNFAEPIAHISFCLYSQYGC